MEGVLVAAVCKKKDQPQSSSSSSHQTRLSGSGVFLQLDGRFDNGGVIVTSASWLAELLQLEVTHEYKPAADKPEVRWSYKNDCKQNDVQFVVLMPDENNESCDSRLSYQSDHVIKKVELVGVYLVHSVYSSLDRQLSSLSHWRVTVGGNEEKQTSGSQNNDSISSLLLDLACVVVLKFTDKAFRSPLFLSYSNQKHSHQVQVGDTVHIIGTPFGSFCPEVFLNSVLSGCVCKLLSSDGAIFLTDARVLPGCEGAPVFDRHHHLLGMVVTGLSTMDGHHSGLALTCSIGSVIEALEGHFKIRNRLSLPHKPTAVQNKHTKMLLSEPSFLPLLADAVVVVTTKDSWGSGIRLTPSLVLTCEHVMKNSHGNYSNIGVSGMAGSQMQCEVVFSSYLPDIALVQITNHHHHTDTVSHDQPWQPNSSCTTVCNPRNTETDFLDYNKHMSHSSNSNLNKGTEVYVIGYGFENPLRLFNKDGAVQRGFQSNPLVTKGTIVNVIGYEDEVVMFVTSAVVHPGMSGGLVVNSNSGEPLGMVVSNSRDKETDIAYPSVNYCLPLSVLLPPLEAFMTTRDISQLQDLSKRWEKVAHLWELKTKLDIDGVGGGSFNNHDILHSKL